MSLTLGIDLGGSAIKAGAVDVGAGEVVGELQSVPTPPGATLGATRVALASLVARFPQCRGPVGLAFPSVVKNGITYTAANIDRGWIGADAAALLTAAAGRTGVVVNDADAAGVAEMRVGAGRDERGLVMMLTFGTGIGSALFVDGRLWPNTEFGHAEVDGREAEHRASARVRTLEQLDWGAWSVRVNRVLEAFHTLLWPDLFIVGGGVSERWDEFGAMLKSRARIVPAKLRHTAGVVGAALHAAETASG
ncbi:MAG TPA: ROK family protein [Steroidobacteraceae bacterium]|nr:ROK family protein [Steroidobacteraceae bacterium]